MDFGDGFECLIFKESFFAYGFEEQCMNDGFDDGGFYFVEILMCEYFSEEGQCFFGVVGPEVVDLGDDMLIELGQQFMQEGGLVVFISLPEGR